MVPDPQHELHRTHLRCVVLGHNCSSGNDVRWGAVAAVSGVSQCRVPAAPGDPDGKGLGWGPEFHCSSQPDGNVSQSAALPGTARGRGVSSSAAPHLHFPNSRPLHYHVHLTTGEE